MIVDVVAVEEELARIQRDLTSSEVRASLFNLVVFSRDAGEAMTWDALNYLLGKRAARVIHIVHGRAVESRLDVSARCFVDAERKSVCFQEIVITNGQDGAGGSPGSWVPLLVRDIPTIILWQDTLAGQPGLLAHAQEQADKLLIDTELAAALGDSDEAVMGAAHRLAVVDRIPVSDFAFRRLRPIQRLVAAAFDDPERTPMVTEIRHVRLCGASALSTQHSARLFSLWMADRLGWRPDGTRFRDQRNRSVEFSHQPAADGCELEVVIEFTSGEHVVLTATVGGCGDTAYPHGNHAHSIVTLPGNGEILLEEVDVLASDALYRNALGVLDR